MKDFRKIVEKYKTKYNQGFTNSELKGLAKKLDIEESKLNEAIGVNTCQVIDNEIITYYNDVENAVNKIFTGRYLFFD